MRLRLWKLAARLTCWLQEKAFRLAVWCVGKERAATPPTLAVAVPGEEGPCAE